MLTKRFGIDTSKQDAQTILYFIVLRTRVKESDHMRNSVLALSWLRRRLMNGVRSENGEVIVIISHSSSVRVTEWFLSTGVLFTVTYRIALLSSIPYFLRRRSSCLIHAGHLSNFSTLNRPDFSCGIKYFRPSSQCQGT